MRQRMTMQVQGEGFHLQLRPGQTAVIGSAEDADIRYPHGSAVRLRHAVVRWRDSRWELADIDGTTGIYRYGQPVTHVELAQPEMLRLGHATGPPVALTPLPRRASRRLARWLLAAAGIVLAGMLIAGFLVARERAVDHRPYLVGACIATDPHWSAGKYDVRPPGRPVNCAHRFDYQVVAVIPVPTPELTSFSTDRRLDRRALELTDGRCPPASWPALGLPDSRRITHEVYCVQDSIYTFDHAAEKEQRDLQCVLRVDEQPRLLTPCDQRHDYLIQELVPLASTAFPGEEEMDRIGEDSCSDTSRLPYVASEQTWQQGYHRVLCLETDNMRYEDTIEWALDDLRAFWDRELPGASSRPSSVKVLDEAKYDPKSPPRCGEDSLVDNAWYCPDDSVAWDPKWLKSAFYDKYGDVAVAIVLAHEWGHVVQNRLGLDDKDRLKQLSTEAREQDLVRQEHQADCYAGVWLWHYYHDDVAEVGFRPSETDRNKAVHAIVEVADPFTSSDEQFEESAHGDALKRMQHLLLGFDANGRQACQELVPA